MAIPSKRQINDAGRALAYGDTSVEDGAWALELVNTWREMHVAPLQLLFEETSAVAESMPTALVTGRIKKLDTIIDKLRRDGTPSKLATMYDIAGCRIVLDNMEDLDNACAIMRGKQSCDISKSGRRDYVAVPKNSGYRGRHLIFTFKLDGGPKLFAELQLRTALQHSWATAVEMYDLAVDDSRLKFNEFDTPAGSFFKLASDAIALIERGSSRIGEIADKIADIERRHGILSILESAQMSMTVLNGDMTLPDESYCLVEQNVSEQSLTVSRLADINAARSYFAREQESANGVNLVLVRGKSMREIERAYPNYFGDISLFTSTMRKLVD